MRKKIALQGSEFKSKEELLEIFKESKFDLIGYEQNELLPGGLFECCVLTVEFMPETESMAELDILLERDIPYRQRYLS